MWRLLSFVLIAAFVSYSSAQFLNFDWPRMTDAKARFEWSCYDRPLNYFYSVYLNAMGENDRVWLFGCVKSDLLAGPTVAFYPPAWSPGSSPFVSSWTFECWAGYALTGMKSPLYHYQTGQRLWAFQCRKLTKAPSMCYWTPYLNSVKGEFKYMAPLGTVVAGVATEYDQQENGRRFQFKVCVFDGHLLSVHKSVACGNKGNEQLSLNCPHGEYMRTLTASIGRAWMNMDCTNAPANVAYSCPVTMNDGINRVSVSCSNQHQCDVPLSDFTFVKPCAETKRYLDVQYACVPGPYRPVVFYVIGEHQVRSVDGVSFPAVYQGHFVPENTYQVPRGSQILVLQSNSYSADRLLVLGNEFWSSTTKFGWKCLSGLAIYRNRRTMRMDYEPGGVYNANYDDSWWPPAIGTSGPKGNAQAIWAVDPDNPSQPYGGSEALCRARFP